MVINSPCLTDKKELAIQGAYSADWERILKIPWMAGSLPKTISAKVGVLGAKKPWGVLLLRLGLREYLNSLMNHLFQKVYSGSVGGQLATYFELLDMVPPTPHDHLSKRLHPGSDEGDASKQGMKSDKTKPMFKDSDFDGLDDDMENVEGETIYAATSGVSTAGALVSTARPTVSTAGPSTSC
ncbi:hypothetical protein Tco_0806350 [Tanacetum coccineum]